MLLFKVMEITISTDIENTATLAASPGQAVTALRDAITLLAAEGRNADFIM